MPGLLEARAALHALPTMSDTAEWVRELNQLARNIEAWPGRIHPDYVSRYIALANGGPEPSTRSAPTNGGPMATITQDTPRHEGSPAPQYVTRKVGPLTCRFVADRALPDGKRPSHIQPLPTVESIALVARQLLGAHAGALSTDPADVRRRALLAPKATRAAAEGAVRTEHLKDAKGVLHTKAAYAPLVTLVRKQLVQDLRESFKALDRADAEAKRQEAKRARAADKAREAAIAKAAKLAKCAVLAEGAKPSKAASKDRTDPSLCGAKLCQDPDGRWQLVATDSYQVCLFPLSVHGDAGLVECWLDADAVKAIEKAGAFRISKGMLEPLTYSTFQQQSVPVSGYQSVTVYAPVTWPAGSTKYAIDKQMRFPRIRDDGRKDRPRKGQSPALVCRAAPASSKRMEITFNARLLAQMAEAIAIDTPGGKLGVVTIVFDVDCFTKREDGVREWNTTGREVRGVRESPTIRIERKDGTRGHLMPVRPKV